MHNRRREAEKNEWMAKALARAARRKLYYDAGLATSPAFYGPVRRFNGSRTQSHSPRKGNGMTFEL